MSSSALRMVLDDLKELFRAKEITFAEYQEGVAAAHTRASSVETEAPVKMEALDTEMQEAPVKIEAPVTSVKCVKSAMKAPVVKEFVPPLPSPRQVGEKAPSDNNNKVVVVVSVVGDRGMTEVGEHVSEEGNVGESQNHRSQCHMSQNCDIVTFKMTHDSLLKAA